MVIIAARSVGGVSYPTPRTLHVASGFPSTCSANGPCRALTSLPLPRYPPQRLSPPMPKRNTLPLPSPSLPSGFPRTKKPLTPSQVKAWSELQEFKAKVKLVGMFVPQSLVADGLGLSKQRVSQFLDQGRLETVELCGIRYVSFRSLVEFARRPRVRSGRPRKVPSGSSL